MSRTRPSVAVCVVAALAPVSFTASVLAQCGPGVNCSILPAAGLERVGRSAAYVGSGLTLFGAPHDGGVVGMGNAYLVMPGCVPVGAYVTSSPFGASAGYGFGVGGVIDAALSTPITVIGAPFEDIGANVDTGAACLRNAATAFAAIPLVRPGPINSGDHFGWSCAALSGAGPITPRAIVGAPGASVPVAGSGEVEVFHGQTGAFIGTILNPLPGANDQFGWAVAAREAMGGCGAFIIVGAPFNDNAMGVNAGAVYVFDATGAQIGLPILPPGAPGSQANAFFGTSLAVVGDKIVVGAPGTVGGSGAAYVFGVTQNCTFTTPVTLSNPTPAPNDQFGAAVGGAPCPGVIAVGAPQDDTGAVDAGSVYLFETIGTFLGQVANPTPGVGDYFGFALAGGAGQMVVGVPGRNAPAIDAGGVYFFTPPVPDCNSNCILDSCDIASGFSVDINCNGIPDECESMCHADIFPDCGNGIVNGADLGVVLGNWGCTGPNCPGDINRDGIVNGADLGIILGCWGPCTGACP